jgi:hypothetical protein
VSNDAARLKQNKSSDLRFSNSSLIFWSGVSLSCYQKTSYKDEADDLVAAGYGYDFGDFKSYAPPELSAASDDHKKFAELFNSGQLQIISARTCYDMNLTPKLSRQIKLLILTADGSPYFEGWSEKTSNAAVCVCDADRGTFFLIHNSIFETTHIEVVPFISNELSCILTVYYGGIFDEDVNSFSGNCC